MPGFHSLLIFLHLQQKQLRLRQSVYQCVSDTLQFGIGIPRCCKIGLTELLDTGPLEHHALRVLNDLFLKGRKPIQCVRFLRLEIMLPGHRCIRPFAAHSAHPKPVRRAIF